MKRMIYHITHATDPKAYQILPENEAQELVSQKNSEWFLTPHEAAAALLNSLETVKMVEIEDLQAEPEVEKKPQAKAKAKRKTRAKAKTKVDKD